MILLGLNAIACLRKSSSQPRRGGSTIREQLSLLFSISEKIEDAFPDKTLRFQSC